MLKNDLYTIASFGNAAGRVQASILLNTAHRIFEGHFPGQPVLPGVCMMQLVKELTEEATGKKLFLNNAAQCKFLSMVDPRRTPELTVMVDYQQPGSDLVTVNAVLKSEDTVFFKMNADLSVEG
ncbi:3-hydroxyacyl-ACP dehydratase [Niabella beijingensis]|uniref:3-hydroxyacyl-ACP dehydratase n=1 Tax=Niabella beijingensis TaxID=2872700 RepID=UPI001CBB1913|nr:3-hydroxyacyl-ACP dehydratase [Niabella beijingensis]MBZ4189824.1 3-hydroxyacyl-ACP dehydratase [Niabella beijingensis]